MQILHERVFALYHRISRSFFVQSTKAISGVGMCPLCSFIAELLLHEVLSQSRRALAQRLNRELVINMTQKVLIVI